MEEALRGGQLSRIAGRRRSAPDRLEAARLAPGLTAFVLLGPLLFGLAGTVLPAFGYLPALGGDHPTVRFFGDLFATPGILRSALLALGTGVATTAIAFTLSLAFVASWVGTSVFARLQHMVSPLLSVPHAAVAFALAFLVSPAGFLLRLVSPWLTGFTRPPDWLVVHDPFALTMIAGLVVKEVPFLLLVMLAALPQVPVAEMRRLAAAFGYGRVAGFVYALAPAIYGQVRLAVYAVVAYASSVVDVAAILGPVLPAPLPVRLLGWMGDPDLSMRFVASAGALVQLAVTAVSLLLWFGLEKLVGGLAMAFCERGVRFRRDRWLRRAALAGMALASGTVFAGIAVLALWSVAGLWQFPDVLPARLTLGTWTSSLPGAAAPLWTTLLVGSLSTLAALLLTVGCLENEAETARRAGSRALFLIYLPLLVPQISFVFGLQVLMIVSGLDGSFPALVLVHLVFVLPYVFLSLADPWRSYDRRYDVVAASFGKSRATILLRVRLPMLLRAMLTAAAVGFAVSVGLYLPTVLIGAGRLTTVTTEAVALASGGNARLIGVYAFLQALLPFFGFAIASLVPALLFRNRRLLAA